MQKCIKSLVLSAALFSSAFVSAWDFRSTARFDIGYRRDSIDWEFDRPSSINPCFSDKIESNFSNIHILEIGLFGDTTFCDCLYARAFGNVGWILDGNNEDKLRRVVGTDDSTIAFDKAKIENILDGRYTADLSLAIGSPFNCWCDFTVTPLIGYSYKSQYLLLERNESIQIIEEDSEPVASSFDRQIDVIISNCHEDKWITRWWGPFIGVDFTYDSCSCWRLYLQLEGHFAYFKGKKQGIVQFDPLIDNFDRSTRRAHGYIVRFGGEYDMSDCWFVGFETYFQRFAANKTTRSCGTFNNFCNSRLHLKAKIHSYALKLTVGTHY